MAFRPTPIVRSRRAWVSRAAPLLYMVISLLLLLGLWQLLVAIVRPPTYILPSLASVWEALVQGIAPALYAQKAGFWYHLEATLKSTLGGLLIGSAIGLVIGVLCAEVRVLEKTLLNYVSALQALPKVALAPLFLAWLGFGLASKVAMASLLTFFPVALNTYTGLKTVERERLVLMRSLQASWWQTLWMVKFPSALPIMFASFHMALVYALLGALVAEFVGATAGMGMLVRNQSNLLDTAGVFASLVVLGLVGFFMSASARQIEWWLIPWVRRNAQERQADN